jgi:hypothetical protein
VLASFEATYEDRDIGAVTVKCGNALDTKNLDFDEVEFTEESFLAMEGVAAPHAQAIAVGGRDSCKDEGDARFLQGALLLVLGLGALTGAFFMARAARRGR